jgi:hypothetical protein
MTHLEGYGGCPTHATFVVYVPFVSTLIGPSQKNVIELWALQKTICIIAFSFEPLIYL